jgi:hypothetical protein
MKYHPTSRSYDKSGRIAAAKTGAALYKWYVFGLDRHSISRSDQ